MKPSIITESTFGAHISSFQLVIKHNGDKYDLPENSLQRLP